jgi:hypothetical protein
MTVFGSRKVLIVSLLFMIPACVLSTTYANEIGVSVTVTLTPDTLPNENTPKQFKGEIVSIDVTSMDTREFFKFVATFSGLNIVVDPAVQST